jgi:hypothetical protein
MLRIAPAALLVLVLVPTKASAVTAQEIVRLSNAGVSEQVILALIERDRTVFTIAPDQLVSLKDQGVSETVLLAMLKSGRPEETTPPFVATMTPGSNAPDAATAASGVDPLLEPGPVVGVVGHGPDRPNTAHTDYFREIGAPDFAAPPAPYPIPYLIPYPVLVPVTNVHNHAHREHAEHTDEVDHKAPCLAPVTPAPVTPPTFRGFGDTGPTSVRGMFFDSPATRIAPRAQSCR